MVVRRQLPPKQSNTLKLISANRIDKLLLVNSIVFFRLIRRRRFWPFSLRELSQVSSFLIDVFCVVTQDGSMEGRFHRAKQWRKNTLCVNVSPTHNLYSTSPNDCHSGIMPKVSLIHSVSRHFFLSRQQTNMKSSIFSVSQQILSCLFFSSNIHGKISWNWHSFASSNCYFELKHKYISKLVVCVCCSVFYRRLVKFRIFLSL